MSAFLFRSRRQRLRPAECRAIFQTLLRDKAVFHLAFTFLSHARQPLRCLFFYFLTQITLFFYRVSQAEFSWRGHRIGIREMEELTLEKARSKSSFHVWLHLKRPIDSGPSLELLLRPVILEYQ